MNLSTWIESAPSPYHARELVVKQLNDFDFASTHQLVLEPRGSGALFAWLLPRQKPKRFCFALAHTDSPTLRLKSKAQKDAAGFSQLHFEVYGGALYNSWLDRDLGLAGKVAFAVGSKVVEKLVRLDLGMRIPQLAIHLDRGVNTEGLRLNPQNHLAAVWAEGGMDLEKLLLQECPGAESVLATDLLAFDLQKPAQGGADQSMLFSARLDNLASCHAMLQGVFRAELAEDQAYALAFFHHEEVGSESREGARSMSLLRSFEEKVKGWGLGFQEAEELRENSRALSLDMAHGLHPNYPEKHDPLNHPLCGHGPVLKSNANMRYATELKIAAELRLLAAQNQIPLQDFHSRNDLGCGSTVGPGFAASLGIPSADLGAPMLSMHSAREMMSLKDHESTILLIQKFFEKQD